ncbi:STAS domain-containing protein [Streptomyces sp. NPDC007088]|uniref:STAS domain-containing protein n=1 Tax=Streptomyces sp. NPDC007088 TaxID=3364773 RepID=UPI003693E1C3
MFHSEGGATVTGTALGSATFVVRVGGDIDHESAPLLQEALDTARRSGAGHTVIDLSGVGFADSTVLHVLLGAERAHRGAGRELSVAGPFGTTVRRLFEVTGTTHHFRLRPSLDAALDGAPDTTPDGRAPHGDPPAGGAA